MADKKDDTEFDDDAFDTEDFSESDFGDDVLEDDSEFAELSPDDVEDDFESDAWQDNKKNKNLYTGGGSGEKSGLSFNAMIMIGAFVLGAGVLGFTIMNATAEQKAGEKSVFRSIMGMAGVMDGVLSGEEETKPTQEDIIAEEQQTKNEGFLNNPGMIEPPQPTPIAPSENEPLTPMPDQAGATPRGPDETPPADGMLPAPGATALADPAQPVPPPVADPDAPKQPTPVSGAASSETAPPPSAEDILKKAMADREQKTATMEDETAPSVPESAPAVPSGEEDVAAAPSDPLATAMPTTLPAAQPASSSTAVADVNPVVENLEAKIDSLMKRMNEIESELGSVKQTKNSDYAQIQETVAALKQDVSALKDQPVKALARRTPTAISSVEEEAASEPEAVVKAAPATKRVKKASAAKSTVSKSAASARWELRAAQPGRAWVSRPGERDMQTVEVGQTLAGVGQVNAISYQNGRWTVYGSQGQIQQ